MLLSLQEVVFEMFSKGLNDKEVATKTFLSEEKIQKYRRLYMMTPAERTLYAEKPDKENAKKECIELFKHGVGPIRASIIIGISKSTASNWHREFVKQLEATGREGEVTKRESGYSNDVLKQVLDLREQGIKCEAIAQILGIPAGTIPRLIKRARERAEKGLL